MPKCDKCYDMGIILAFEYGIGNTIRGCPYCDKGKGIDDDEAVEKCYTMARLYHWQSNVS